MGRLRGTRQRALLSLAYVLAAVGGAVLSARLEMASGVPAVSFTLALAVAYLLSIGPRGGLLVGGAFLVHGLAVHDGASAPVLVLVAGVQAVLAVVLVLVAERRFRGHGGLRHPVVASEFVVLLAAALPLLTQGAAAVLGVTTGHYLQHALAEGVGVLGVTAGVRMLVMGERVQLERSVLAGVLTAATITVAAVLVTLRVAGSDVLGSAHVAVVPLLVIALLVGTAGYSIAILLTTVGVLVPVALTGLAGAWELSTWVHASWWLVGAGGIVLASDGDRRRAAIREFRTFFLRSATATFSVSAADGTILLANPAAARLLGTTAAELRGRAMADVVIDDPNVQHLLRSLLAREVEEFTAEFRVPADGGAARWVRCVAIRVDLGGPQHDVVQVQFVDLTAEREREAGLERSNEALERFGRRVTHDLKQPLSAVAAYASTLAEHAERMDPDVVRTMYERLEAVAKRAVGQLDETFAAAALPTAGPVRVQLREVVSSVVGVIDIDLTEADGSVDTALTVARVQADPSTLRQILLNLLTNSLKYAAVEEPPQVRVASRVRGAGVEITVTDNGTGLPPDELEAVFERGRRLDPDRADGRGHGLADSRELAESAGGTLHAEPWADGARFVLWLPDPALAETVSVTRVLLVEDEQDALTLLQRRLGLQASIEVVGTAGTIDEAVAATGNLRPDVILLDRWLRDEDGLSGVLRLARAHPDARIILLTADVSPGLPERARAGGVLHTLDKTVSDEDLVSRLVGIPS
jgi:PAS domain S-box-containing protein